MCSAEVNITSNILKTNMENEKLLLKCKLGVLTRPDGSAMLCQDETTVIAGIYGPVEAKPQKQLIDKASVEAHYRPKSGLPGVEDRFYESIIRNICETCLVAALYPRSSVEIIIQELHNNGQLISCAVNAACLATLHSGIDMKCMFAAVSCFLGPDGTLQLKSQLNEKLDKASFVFVFDSTQGKIIASHTIGAFTEEVYEEALNLCRNESQHVFQFFKSVLLNST